MLGNAWLCEPNVSDYNDLYDLCDDDIIDYNDLDLFTDDWPWQGGWAKTIEGTDPNIQIVLVDGPGGNYLDVTMMRSDVNIDHYSKALSQSYNMANLALGAGAATNGCWIETCDNSSLSCSSETHSRKEKDTIAENT